MEDRTELSPTGCNGVTRSALRAGAGPEVVPGTAGTPASPDGPPQVRFKVTAGQPARVKRDRRRTVSAASRLSDSTSPDDESLTLERRAPDGGWGWVVVAAAFTVNMIADGICFSFGVFFVEFLRYFGSSKSTTSWLGSIFLSLPLLLGPPASSVVDRLGCRSTTIAGALLSAAGFVLSYFVDSMELLFITFSVMPGIGLSLCYVSAVVIVAYYFERRRSLATGISVCGTGVGTFLFPPLVEHLIQEYGWRGSLLVLSGIFLNIAVCGMLMRDLDWTRHKNRERSSQMTFSADGDTASLTSEAGSLPDIQQLRDALQSGDVSALLSRPVSAEQLERLHSSALQLPTWLSDTDVPPEVRRTVETNRRLHELVSRLYPHLLLSAAGQEGAAARPASPLCLRSAVVAPPAADRPAAAGPAAEHAASCDVRSRPRPTADGAARPDAALVRGSRSVPHHQRLPLPPLFACDAEPSADYLRNLRLRRQSMTYRGAMLNIHRYRLRASSCPDIYRNSMITILSEDEDEDCWSCVRDVARMLQKMLDVSYFRLPAFTLFALSNFVLYMFYDVPYVYLADHAIGGGASDEEASMLISVIGISNVVGVLLIGYLGDQPPVSSTALYVACMLACGVATLVVPSCRTYSALVVVSSVFGFCISANYTLAPTILVDLISIENFTNAYGILLLVQGLANLIGPPLCGMLHDLTASYALTFRSAGAAMAVSGLLLCVARAGTVSRRLLRRTAAAV